MSLLRRWPTVPLPTRKTATRKLCCVDIAARQRLSLTAGDVNREGTMSPSDGKRTAGPETAESWLVDDVVGDGGNYTQRSEACEQCASLKRSHAGGHSLETDVMEDETTEGSFAEQVDADDK